MILQKMGDELIVIRQTDHAFLAGFFARHWGNELFAAIEPRESFCLAAAEHDNGWTDWELLPELDPKTQAPYSFMSIPTSVHIELYQRGIERLVRADHYAGLLASLHCAGLYDRARATMPGYSAKYVKSNETQLTSDFVQRLRLQQLRLKVDLRANEKTKPLVDEEAIKANMQRLEALDRLSLYFCMGTMDDATIEGVPVRDGEEPVDWDLRRQGEHAATLGPYPFDRNPLEFSILTRRVPSRFYASDEDFQRTLGRASYLAMRFELRAGDAHATSRAAAF
jgi:hypothetical protein